ncbi:envelope stress response membrane protein PspB [Arenibaculum sp.]|uniref:envelope stress response membrane protein PspB n=1 Tax=Arenibaculum sp. TaxID=2865862 RepID=UPI002E113141|nr:envelope stress response membrane protein PspB [Arenibaculum sp.]
MIGGGVFLVLAVLFLTIVAPIWIIFHYLTRWRTSRSLSAEDERMLAEMWDSAQRIENRVTSLEKILDAEAPGWRTRS